MESTASREMLVQMQLITYADLRGREHLALDFVPRALALMRRPDIIPEVRLEFFSGASARRYRFGERNWQKITRRALAGEVSRLRVWLWEGRELSTLAEIRVDLPSWGHTTGYGWGDAFLGRRPSMPKAIQLEFPTRWWDHETTRRAHLELVPLLNDFAIALKACVGHIGIVDARCRDPLPWDYNWSGTSLMSYRHCRYLRGVFWAQLLTKGHVLAMGGSEALKRAPCHLAEVIEEPRDELGPRAFLQLTEDLVTTQGQSLVDLTTFLSPLEPIPSPWQSYLIEPSMQAHYPGIRTFLQQSLPEHLRFVADLPDGSVVFAVQVRDFFPPEQHPLDEIRQHWGTGPEGPKLYCYRRYLTLPEDGHIGTVGILLTEKEVETREKKGAAVPSVDMLPVTNEENLPVTVSFYQNPTSDQIDKLRNMLDGWACSWWDWRPGAELRWEERELTGPVYCFDIDIVTVGQDALTHLYLLLDQYSIDVAPLRNLAIGEGYKMD